ncbi:MAG: hypothetical protein JXA77_16365 [Bacteroidales bacterium]|nr:hypothetical protein [Bacteroidales bacterium]MBN2818877.1 hypothetical protein [Bacteroidales bacterium]
MKNTDNLFYLLFILASIVGSIVQSYKKKADKKRAEEVTRRRVEEVDELEEIEPEEPRRRYNPLEEFLREQFEELNQEPEQAEEPEEPKEEIKETPAYWHTKPTVEKSNTGSSINIAESFLTSSQEDSISNEEIGSVNSPFDKEFSYENSDQDSEANDKEDFEFDPVKAIIYSEILKRQEY